MTRPSNLIAHLCAFSLIALFAATPAAADRPSWVGDGGKGKQEDAREDKHEGKSEKRHEKHKGKKSHESKESHFGDADRRAINEYYGAKFRKGKCPPGLAKKGNGCMPPGQAKKWAVGQPLPADLTRHPLPRDLLATLPPPPGGHSYVRVASDILLIATGTSIVMDAIEDIGKQF